MCENCEGMGVNPVPNNVIGSPTRKMWARSGAGVWVRGPLTDFEAQKYGDGAKEGDYSVWYEGFGDNYLIGALASAKDVVETFTFAPPTPSYPITHDKTIEVGEPVVTEPDDDVCSNRKQDPTGNSAEPVVAEPAFVGEGYAGLPTVTEAINDFHEQLADRKPLYYNWVETPRAPLFWDKVEDAEWYGSPFESVLAEIQAMHDRKSKDYGYTDDPYSNVRASSDFGIPSWVGTLVRANDKMRRLQKAAQGHDLANESIEDSLLDLATYAVIALVLYREV